MTREDITRMAREAGFVGFDGDNGSLRRFAALVADAERKALMQLFTDPENQPTQHGTVTLEYMQQEIAAEREACATVCDGYTQYGDPITNWSVDCAAAIRARGEEVQS